MGSRMRWLCALAMIAGVAACSMKRTSFTPPDEEPADAAIDAAAAADAPTIDAPPALGTRENPARSCGELKDAGMPSAAYWVRPPADQTLLFQVYCEQALSGGGWAMLENSVRRDDGTTTAFWGFPYAERLKEMGTLAIDQNYYNGALYLIGTEYMDIFVDLQDKTAVAAVMTATGFDPVTMRFTSPALVAGNASVYANQFASGWSARDFDGDPYGASCAANFSNVAQHYSQCWTYNLGSDADAPVLDGGVGPHVNNAALGSLGLALQPNGGNYSQVKRIARFTRW